MHAPPGRPSREVSRWTTRHPQILATYVEDELVAEAAVSTCYSVQPPD